MTIILPKQNVGFILHPKQIVNIICYNQTDLVIFGQFSNCQPTQGSYCIFFKDNFDKIQIETDEQMVKVISKMGIIGTFIIY